MRVLLLCSAFNGMSQRVHRELDLMGCELTVQLATGEADMLSAVERFQPDLVLCPYLTHKIPDIIWQEFPCLVVHPGIEGDRGPSSLDWAVSGEQPEWGVTLLQANAEMDAGDIWGTSNFPLRKGASKASLYRREVTTRAIALIKGALKSMKDPAFAPRPLEVNTAPGRLLPAMTQADRAIDWSNDNTSTVLRKFRAADSIPGIREQIGGVSVNLFGGVIAPGFSGETGEFIASSNGCLCRATVDGAVWIKHAKIHGGIKLPAQQVLEPLLSDVSSSVLSDLPEVPAEIEDVTVEYADDVAYLHFSFHGGAMSTAQCEKLLNTYRALQLSDAKVIVLMGGEEFWSNGIHLNMIEAAENPADESWKNINAIDDFVECVINTKDKLTVAALRSNAGAGGAMMALACDYVILRDGVVINPHYKSMGLFGSEYWTYLLPRRVGDELARELTENCLPILATEALDMGYGDEIFDEQFEVFYRELNQFCQKLSDPEQVAMRLAAKSEARAIAEAEKPLQQYRDEELAVMRKIFYEPEAEYHQARKEFVYKKCPKTTPAHLQPHLINSNLRDESALSKVDVLDMAIN